MTLPHWRRKGGTTLEMALSMPLLLVMVFGVIEYGWLFLKAEQITDAARSGARFAIRPDVTTVGEVADPNYSPAPPPVAMLKKAGIPVRSNTIRVPTGVTPGTGNPVVVEVIVPYSDVRLIGFPLTPVPSELRASVSMAKEGL